MKSFPVVDKAEGLRVCSVSIEPSSPLERMYYCPTKCRAFYRTLSCEGLLRRRRGPQDREFLIVPLENSYLILLNLRNNTFNDFLCCIRSIIFSKSVNFANGESLLVHMRGEKVTTYAGGGLHDLLSLCL